MLALGPSSTTERPITSTFSTTCLTSPVSTMLLPPPSTNLGKSTSAGSASNRRTSSSLRTRTSCRALATMPKLLWACRGTFCSTIMGELSHQQSHFQGASMPSFDTVCEPNMVEVKNAVDNAAKEIGTRFDFKGTSAAVELKDKDITLFGDADFQLTQVEDVLTGKLTKRG